MLDENKFKVEREVKQLITIEKQGSITYPKTFNDKFNSIQTDLIHLLKSDSRCCTDYGYLYLRYLEYIGLIKINFIPDTKFISSESISRLRRKLYEYAEYGNKELEFLLKFKDSNNEELNKESKEYYRSN